jgi:hypothetical protein
MAFAAEPGGVRRQARVPGSSIRAGTSFSPVEDARESTGLSVSRVVPFEVQRLQQKKPPLRQFLPDKGFLSLASPDPS